MFFSSSAFFFSAFLASVVAAFFDIRKGHIPNWLSYGCLVLAPLAHVAKGLSLSKPFNEALTEGGYSILGAVLAAFIPLMLYRYNAIGGGDVKFLAALGAILLPHHGIEAELYIFFSAALLAPVKLAYDGHFFSSLKNSASILINSVKPPDKQTVVDKATLNWFRLGPFLVLGLTVFAFLNRGSIQ